MNITLKEGNRVYQVTTSTGKQIFCNIDDLNKVVKYLGCREGYFKIYHFWNNKAQRLTRKALDELFEGAQLKKEFYY